MQLVTKVALEAKFLLCEQTRHSGGAGICQSADAALATGEIEIVSSGPPQLPDETLAGGDEPVVTFQLYLQQLCGADP